MTLKHTPYLLNHYNYEIEKTEMIKVNLYEIETVDRSGHRTCPHSMKNTYLCGNFFETEVFNGQGLIVADWYFINRVKNGEVMDVEESYECSRRFCNRAIVRKTLVSYNPIPVQELSLEPTEVYRNRENAINGYSLIGGGLN